MLSSASAGCSNFPAYGLCRKCVDNMSDYLQEEKQVTGNSGGRMEGMAHLKKQLAGGKMNTFGRLFEPVVRRLVQVKFLRGTS